MKRDNYARNRYATLKEMHRCTRCGAKDERTLSGKINCAECAKRQSENARRHAVRKAEIENRGCAYCNAEDLLFNGRVRKGSNQKRRVGIDIYLIKNELVISSLADTVDDSEMDARVRIKYCPMCGRKFKRNGD